LQLFYKNANLKYSIKNAVSSWLIKCWLLLIVIINFKDCCMKPWCLPPYYIHYLSLSCFKVYIFSNNIYLQYHHTSHHIHLTLPHHKYPLISYLYFFFLSVFWIVASVFLVILGVSSLVQFVILLAFLF
jgi:hypothetical protein